MLQPPNITVHNLSTFTLTQSQINLLNKGLSFSPIPNISVKDHLALLSQYNKFGDLVRRSFYNTHDHPPTQHNTDEDDLVTTFLFRKMRFLKNQQQTNYVPPASSLVENFIHTTKDLIDENLPAIYTKPKPNLSSQEYKALHTLRNSTAITIKPADKNLGIVLLNTDDYMQQCLSQLKSTAYQRVKEFPAQLCKDIENCIIKFKTEICQYSQQLYRYLIPPKQHRIPRFYGLPKVHKNPTLNNMIPPVRPIVSHTDSLLSHTAKFIDHLLQPLARSYKDYLHNSTELVHQLSTLYISEDVTLVGMDIISLFPSIPQNECLQILKEEMDNHKDLLLFDPNLILTLLNINIHNNYFDFANCIFQQTTGIAMGAAFSPTIANIFMSNFLKKFLKTTKEHPLVLSRYIDDIFIIWPTKYNFDSFLSNLNNFHPNIKFTVTVSINKIDFLDLTIYKGHNFSVTKLLDIKTFQKPNSLYQYLYFDSFCPKNNLERNNHRVMHSFC